MEKIKSAISKDSSPFKLLQEKISSKKAKIGIIGLGYVGLPMAISFAGKGYRVNGLEVSRSRLAKLKRGRSYITDISDAVLRKALAGGLDPSGDPGVLYQADIIIVCVPTPIRKTKVPNMSYIIAACKTIRKYIRPGQLIILESTTYPGTTRDVMLPILEKSGLIEGKDFFLAFSPERIDPGNKKYDFTNIPKVIGGVSLKAGKLASSLYAKVVKETIVLKNAEAAEVVKLLENTFRIVNIALINEFAMLADKLNIDIWNVVDAAKSKPFGFMPFYPGPGIGGHCIPHDPHYLSWKAKTVGFTTHMIDNAAKVNAIMPMFAIKRVKSILKRKGKTLRRSKVLIIGVTYKKDVFDIRESPALEIIEGLQKARARVTYHDTYTPFLKIHSIDLRSVRLTGKILRESDCVMIVTDHSHINYRLIATESKIVFDTRNALRDIKNPRAEVYKL